MTELHINKAKVIQNDNKFILHSIAVLIQNRDQNYTQNQTTIHYMKNEIKLYFKT